MEWMMFMQMEPIGEARADWRAAAQMALLANINRDGKRVPRPYQAKDFLLRFTEPSRRRDWKELKAIMTSHLEGHESDISQVEKVRRRLANSK